MKEHLIPVKRSTTMRVSMADHIDDTQHVRLYGSSPGRANLQVRSKGPTAQSSKATHWQCYSSAYLDVEAAKAIREALTEWIDEQ